MTWNIVCDSSCDLKASMFKSDCASFHIVPMRILVGGEDFLDDENLNIPELLDAMEEDKTASSTACPSPGAFAKVFESADRTICFTISSNLSGTYNAAVMGREMVLEEHPEKQICVIDSRSTAGAMVLLVRQAVELISADPNADFDKICNQLRTTQAAQRTVFTLECFDNLIKNGRMRPLVGNLLKTLGIHILANGTPQGTIHVAGKARGEVRTYRAIVELMRESKDCTGASVVISHCENLQGAMKLKNAILEGLPVKDVSILSCRGLTTFYAMEKGLIVGF